MTSNESFGKETGGIEVAKTFASRLAGKITLVTGVGVGNIGDATARAFAAGGASTVIITARDDTKLAEVLKALSADYPGTKFLPLKLNLSNLKAVRQAAQEILEDSSIPQIDILVANAGGNSFRNVRTETDDGIESHFGVNHLSHFVFINTLLPKIKAAAQKNAPGDTRIVAVTSGAIFGSPVRFSDWNYENKPVPDDEKPNWGPVAGLFGLAPEPGPFEYHIAYAQAKTAQNLTTVQLNKLLAKEGIYSFSAEPGYVWSTGAKREIPQLPEHVVKVFGTPKTIDQGAATTLVAALDPKLKVESGSHLNDCQPAMAKCPSWASDEKAAERLWKLSEEIVESKLKA